MNCDGIAPWYRWLEYVTFGAALQRRRLEYIHEITNAQKVLILGDGDGRFTAEFLKRNQAALVDSIDISPGMARLAERRIRRTECRGERVRLFVADALKLELQGHYDLVVTHFFLDCFTTENAEELVKRVCDAACSGAKWIVSEFRVPRGGFRRLAAVLLIRALYLCFRILTGLRTKWLPNHAMALECGGFRRVRQKTGLGGLLVSELWEKEA